MNASERATRWNRDHPERRRELNRLSYHRTGRRFTRYGLTKEAYDAMLEEQGGTCAICPETKGLQIDHDHTTKEVRGILCGPCNRGLGKFEDDPERLEAAARFLRRGQQILDGPGRCCGYPCKETS